MPKTKKENKPPRIKHLKPTINYASGKKLVIEWCYVHHESDSIVLIYIELDKFYNIIAHGGGDCPPSIIIQDPKNEMCSAEILMPKKYKKWDVFSASNAGRDLIALTIYDGRKVKL